MGRRGKWGGDFSEGTLGLGGGPGSPGLAGRLAWTEVYVAIAEPDARKIKLDKHSFLMAGEWHPLEGRWSKSCAGG